MLFHKFGYDGCRCFKLFHTLFHTAIIALFCLMLLGCGNKGDPSYAVLDNNGSVIEVIPYKKLNRW